MQCMNADYSGLNRLLTSHGIFALPQNVVDKSQNRYEVPPIWCLIAVTTQNLANLVEDGRGGEIRTHAPLYPKQVRYQTAPRPDREAHLANRRGQCPELTRPHRAKMPDLLQLTGDAPRFPVRSRTHWKGRH